MGNENLTNVTIRVQEDLYSEFKIACISKKTIVKNVLENHIRNQISSYAIPNSGDKEYSNLAYKKVSIRIDTGLYSDYKIVMIRNKTTPTADLIRFMRQYVEEQ